MTTKRTKVDIVEIESRSHNVTVTLSGGEYLDMLVLAEREELTVPEFVTRLVQQRRVLMFTAAEEHARKQAAALRKKGKKKTKAKKGSK